MERPGIPQVTTAEAREIRGGFRDLFVTMREALAPPTITLQRVDPTTGALALVATFQPETLALPRRQELSGGANAGRVTVTNAGRMTVDADIPVKRDHRFQIDGQWAVVTDVPPEVNAIGYRTVDFRLEV